MAKTVHYKTLADLHKGNGLPPPEHPLLSIVNCRSNCPMGDREFTSDCYMIGFKKLKAGVIMYGRTRYDHSNGTMMFVKPRQIIEMKNLEVEENAFMMFIHEDYLAGHELHNTIQKYGFFDYETSEALHLAPKEETIIWELYHKIEGEYTANPDEYSREIIITHIASILMYAQRFYKRQFINRTDMSGKTVTRFNEALQAYYASGLLQRKGLPSVQSLADDLSVSARYLSDLLKQETGKTAMDLIHISLMAEAKNQLKTSGLSVAEVAYGLGFENTSYFTRLFKKQVGLKPLEFKKMSLN